MLHFRTIIRNQIVTSVKCYAQVIVVNCAKWDPNIYQQGIMTSFVFECRNFK